LRIARFHANPTRTTTSGPPIPPTYVANGTIPPSAMESIIFYPNAFRGCSSLETLDVRYAWNVYFARGVFAEIGTHLALHLFDDGGPPGGKSYGHPQTDMYLGDDTRVSDYGRVSLKSIRIYAPVVTGVPRILPPDVGNTGILHDIRGRYGEYFKFFLTDVYKEGSDDLYNGDGIVLQYSVTLTRVPAY